MTVQNRREQVWQALIPQLARTFFVINNIDQSSGLINVSYSGDPERFVDCGRITSTVTNLRGTRNYDFPAASAQQHYEIMDRSNLYGVARTMSLEGRANLVLEAVSAGATRLTVNIRYVLTKRVQIQPATGPAQEDTQSISFNSGESAAFPRQSGQPTTCHSTGELERQLLNLLPPSLEKGSPPNPEMDLPGAPTASTRSTLAGGATVRKQ